MRLTKKQKYIEDVLIKTCEAAKDIAFQRILEGKQADSPARQLVLALIELEIELSTSKGVK